MIVGIVKAGVFFVVCLEGDASSSLLSTVARRALILDRGVSGSGEAAKPGEEERDEDIVVI